LVNRVEQFPLPKKDVRPFPDDFAMRGLLRADNYFPDEWLTNEKSDEEEKYYERASMAAQRKERILLPVVRIANACSLLNYKGKNFSTNECSYEDEGEADGWKLAECGDEAADEADGWKRAE
jgi:hypothetical protein